MRCPRCAASNTVPIAGVRVLSLSREEGWSPRPVDWVQRWVSGASPWAGLLFSRHWPLCPSWSHGARSGPAGVWPSWVRAPVATGSKRSCQS